MSKLNVSLCTPAGSVCLRQVDAVTAPSVSGEVTILPNHRSLLATLDVGVVTLTTDKAREHYAVSGGYLEVDRDHVRILAETALAANAIDVERARTALKDAQSACRRLDPLSEAYAEERARIRRAEVRLAVAELR